MKKVIYNKYIIKLLNKYGFYNVIDFTYLDDNKRKIWKSAFFLKSVGNKFTLENDEIRKHNEKDDITVREKYDRFFK